MPESPLEQNAVALAFPQYSFAPGVLGTGTFKTAYLVTAGDSQLALKVVHSPVAEPGDSLGERLSREIRAMKAVSNPHVVAVVDGPALVTIGADDFVWFTEPYYAGGTLDARLEHGVLGLGLTMTLLRALLSAVEALWAAGHLVHRDIKPSNIAFASDGVPVLIDLGIAYHPMLPALTDAFGASPRTPLYAAPEQFVPRRMAQIDFRTDLFLIGIICWEAITGAHPFAIPGAALDDAYFGRLCSGALDSAPLSAAGAPPELCSLIERMLRPNPNQRFRKISHVQAAAGAVPL